jgi:DNA-binding GntR family transcriptional regulator
MTPPGTFARVYAAIRQRLRQGAYKPGTRLEPAMLSDELNASVTPVRDALHRLTGERLVEAPRHEGFRVPQLSEARLRHLYAWHLDLLLLALMRRPSRVPNSAQPPKWEDAVSAHEQRRETFLAIARSTGNPEHVLALESVAERLQPLEQLEDMLLDEIERESDAIFEALRSGEPRRLRRQLVSYHRRRERIVPELLERLERE